MRPKLLPSTLALLLAVGGLRPAFAVESAQPKVITQGAATITNGDAADGVITLEVEEAGDAEAKPGVVIVRPVPGAVEGRRVLIRRIGTGAAPVPFQVAQPPRTITLVAEAQGEPGRQGVIEVVGSAPMPMKKVSYLGVSTSPVAPSLASHLKLPEGFGLTVDHAQPGEPAEKAGLKAHDVLIRFGDQKLVNATQLGALVRAQRPGDEVELTLIREGKEMKVKVTLIEKEVPAFSIATAPTDGFAFTPGVIGGEVPHIAWQRAGVPARWDGDIAQSTMRYADGEHQLEITTGKDGRRLVVKDKEGKETFSGLINTPEERQAVPQAIQPKLEKLEKSTRVRMHRFTPGLPLGPGAGAGAIELELVEPFDGADLKALIEEQFKGLKLEGADEAQIKKRIDELKTQIDQLMKQSREQQERFRGGLAPLPGQPGGPAGNEARREFRQASATSMIQMNDGAHAITIKTEGDGKHVTIKDNEGKELFAGPLNTDEDRAKIPAELREKIERIEKSVNINAKGAADFFGGAARTNPQLPAERKHADKEDDK